MMLREHVCVQGTWLRTLLRKPTSVTIARKYDREGPSKTTCTHDPNKETSCEEARATTPKLGLPHSACTRHSGDLTCKVCLQTFESTGAAGAPEVDAGKSAAAWKEKHPQHGTAASTRARTSADTWWCTREGRTSSASTKPQRFGRKDHLTRYMKKSHNQELLGRSRRSPGLLDPFTCNVSVPIKDELLPVMSLPSSELLSKPFPSTLQLNLYNTASSLCRAWPLLTWWWSPLLPLGMTCPIDMDAVHPPTTFLQVPVQFYLIRHLYSEKNSPLKGDWELPDGAAGRRALLLPGLLQRSLVQTGWAAAWVPGGQHGGPLPSKSSISISDPLNTPALIFLSCSISYH